jgi:O-antigen ligase
MSRPVTAITTAAESTPSTLPNRSRYLMAFALLLAAGLVLDPSIYVGGLIHFYLHDLTSLAALVLGLMVMVRTRSELVPKALYVPAGLLVFLAADTIVGGAINYPRTPALMHKLFWFEHLDALRILGELFAWIWAFGQLRPSLKDALRTFDIALWGGAAGVALTGTWYLVTNAPHFQTDPFDLTVMFGLPMSLVYAFRRTNRADLVRLALFGGGCLLLYSRTAMVTIAFTSVVFLVAARDWRKSVRASVPVLVGALLVVVVPYAAGFTGLLPREALTRFLSIGVNQLAPYTIPSRVIIWKDALHMFEGEPLFGVGYHDYFLYSHVSEVKNGTANAPADLPAGLIKQGHDEFLTMLAETGVVGAALYVGFWFLLLRGAYRLWRLDPDDRLWHAFTAGFLVSIVCVSLVGEILIPRTPNWVAPSAVWWVMIALVFLEQQRLEQPRRPLAPSIPGASH